MALVGCGSDEELEAADLVGLYVLCATAECEILRDDGLELTSDGEFLELKLEREAGQPDPQALVYCEIPAGTYELVGAELTVTRRRSDADPVTFGASLEGDRLVLEEGDGEQHTYLRGAGAATGLCPGVL